MEAISHTFGDLIRQRREQLRLTLREASKIRGLRGIAKFEVGLSRPGSMALVAMSDLFNIPLTTLIEELQTNPTTHVRGSRRASYVHPRTKLAVEQVEKIRGIGADMTLPQLARWVRMQWNVNVSESWLSLVLNGKRRTKALT